ncbi:MAG TPA: DUF3011 domain-containing protein [Candidatus Acidoferrum sp.]|nr:DUF3011 domain-containing protein [Candidatus Acidoferrum sp.]
MRAKAIVRLLATAVAMAAIPTMIHAQQTVKCESNDGKRKYCYEVYQQDQVSMQQQISGSPCEAGRTWGVDGRGLWVDRGCRAIFVIGRRGGSGEPEGGWWKRDQNDSWPPRGDWHGGRWDRGGACFYKDRDFGGDFFCLRRGESRESLGSYGDDISSIRVFGGARVMFYDDRNFRGRRGGSGGDVPDLRGLPVRGKPGHTWNNRISSVAVQ